MWGAWIRDGAWILGESADLMGEHKGTLFTGGRGGHREVNVLSGRDLGKSFLGRMSRSAHLDEGVTRCVCCAPQLCTGKQRVSPRSPVFTLFALSKDPELGSLFVLLLNLTTPPSFHYLHLLLLKCLQGPRYAVNT